MALPNRRTTLQVRLMVLFFALVLSSLFHVSAQVDTASLTGLVTDSTGAVVPGARVVATNKSTNLASETVTTEDGYYTITNLRPGLYTIDVEKDGFKRESKTEVKLSVDQRARLDFALSVGAVSETITVTSDTSVALQRSDASLGNVVDSQRITTLPLLQRSWDDLITQVA
jgi:hypothetical protein